MIQETSRQAYYKILDDGTLGTNQIKILWYIVSHPDFTDLEISNETNIPINCVTGRRNELLKLNFIECSGEKQNTTGHIGKTWRIK